MNFMFLVAVVSLQVVASLAQDAAKEPVVVLPEKSVNQKCRMFPDDNSLDDVVSTQQEVEVGGKVTRLCQTKYMYGDFKVFKEFECLSDGVWSSEEVCKTEEEAKGNQRITIPLASLAVLSSFCTATSSISCLLCFPPTAAVKTDVGQKDMKDIKKGDKVLTVTEDGEVKFSAVTVVIHAAPDKVAPFVEVTTATNRTMKVTPDHYVIVYDSAVGAARHVPAGSVKVGDQLIVVADDMQAVKADKVVSARTVIERGIYAPVTSSGSIVVDSVLASVYDGGFPGVLRQPRWLHVAGWPLRAAGIPLSSMYKLDTQGIPAFATLSHKFFMSVINSF